MASVTLCPEPATLELLLQGGMDDVQCLALEEHLERCSACMTLVQRLTCADPLVKAMAGQGRAASLPLFEGVDVVELTERFKAMRPGVEDSGTMIGPYELCKQLGEGGMGTVWLAEQTKPVRRTVALKLIKAGMDSTQVLARFEAERQALALMDHANIAKVLDAGTTASGRPFFVMELVNGMPITAYCDQHQLTPRERLELLMPVCQAIQHAHHKGIIHRDIKPNNVLVATYEGKAVPKVIDFGVAKATGEKLTEQTLATSPGHIVGTLEYMSPEQAEFNSLDIDTRSDIYALGVVLYELLTGTTPFPRDRLRQAPLAEALRMIREEEPARPSTRLRESKETLPAVAARRSTEPTKLGKLVRGDLDWLVMKALEKDRNRRYDSANGLALDMQRYLHDEPVLASPPSAFYRLRKFARRNKGPLTAAAVVLLALVGGLFGTSLALVEAQTQRDAARANQLEAEVQKTKAQASEADARAVLKFFEEKVLSAGRPPGKAGGLGFKATILEAVVAAEPGITEAFRHNPLVEASIRDVLGQTYWHLFIEDERAAKHHERALQLRMAFLGPDHPDTLTSMNNLALAYQAAHRLNDALVLFEETLKRRIATLGKDHPHTLITMSNLGNVYWWSPGRRQDALPLFEEAMRLSRANLGGDDPDTLQRMGSVAMAFQDAGRFTEALALLEEMVKLRTSKLGRDHADTLQSMISLAQAYFDGERLDDAIALYEEAMKLSKAKVGMANQSTITSMMYLSVAYEDVGQLVAAELILRELEDFSRQQHGAENLGHANRLAALGRNLIKQHKYGDAEPLLRECVAINEKKREAAAAWATFNSMCLLGSSLLGQQKYAEAEPLLLQGYQGLKERALKIPPIGLVLGRIRLSEAVEWIVELYEATDQQEKAQQWRTELEVAKREVTKAK